MAKAPAGYSGKPLIAKLGFKPGEVVLCPEPHPDLATLLPGHEDITLIGEPAGPCDAVWLFCADYAALAGRGPALLPDIRQGGMCWISWPKKRSKLFIDLTEDGVREIMLPTGWVDVKVCAVDEDWSGLKFLRRKT